MPMLKQTPRPNRLFALQTHINCDELCVSTGQDNIHSAIALARMLKCNRYQPPPVPATAFNQHPTSINIIKTRVNEIKVHKPGNSMYTEECIVIQTGEIGRLYGRKHSVHDEEEKKELD